MRPIASRYTIVISRSQPIRPKAVRVRRTKGAFSRWPRTQPQRQRHQKTPLALLPPPTRVRRVGGAALQGLKNGFPEIFKRSEYAWKADNDKVRDVIVEITGLQKSDPVAKHILNTFNVVRSFIGNDVTGDQERRTEDLASEVAPQQTNKGTSRQTGDLSGMSLAYNINIVLPETSDLAILNAIFKSIKENLLR
jgi:hypothetical protein